jgi:hypothetical protein
LTRCSLSAADCWRSRPHLVNTRSLLNRCVASRFAKPAIYLVIQTVMPGFQLGNNRPSGNSDGRTGLEARTPLHARGSWLSARSTWYSGTVSRLATGPGEVPVAGRGLARRFIRLGGAAPTVFAGSHQALLASTGTGIRSSGQARRRSPRARSALPLPVTRCVAATGCNDTEEAAVITCAATSGTATTICDVMSQLSIIRLRCAESVAGSGRITTRFLPSAQSAGTGSARVR